MSDTPIIIKAINDMHKAFSLSLKEVYTEIKGCDSRVNEIEKALEVKKALCKKKKEDEKQEQEKAKETKTFWRSIFRAVSIAGILTLCALIWKRLMDLWDMLP